MSEPRSEEIQNARREVKHYFYSAYDLLESGLITLSTMKKICDHEGMKLLFDVVEDLEKIVHYSIQTGKSFANISDTDLLEAQLDPKDQIRFDNLRKLKENNFEQDISKGNP